MEILVKTEFLNELYDLYGSLLTEKQSLYFKLYYHDDYSLQEIANLYNVSRNAVFDHLKKVEEHLLKYEELLKLKENKQKRLDLIDEYLNNQNINLIYELRKLDE